MTAASGARDLDRYFSGARQRHLDELTDFLRIPSVGKLPPGDPAMTRAATWVVEQLRAVGVPVAEVLPTAGHPVAYGASRGWRGSTRRSGGATNREPEQGSGRWGEDYYGWPARCLTDWLGGCRTGTRGQRAARLLE